MLPWNEGLLVLAEDFDATDGRALICMDFGASLCISFHVPCALFNMSGYEAHPAR